MVSQNAKSSNHAIKNSAVIFKKQEVRSANSGESEGIYDVGN
jgi:hypothetical protein